ncbi:hypothetical protein QJS04_geneDACA012042 [Acorus gramineus]|uniref:Transmembrane protein n=1 Tax=Acorus gramineus TaxID=55184 RepID=A0AAV9B934_ACOGR|nr:hypothetical protein QJS04_geneDACA012042 [Acorus gramineus]
MAAPPPPSVAPSSASPFDLPPAPLRLPLRMKNRFMIFIILVLVISGTSASTDSPPPAGIDQREVFHFPSGDIIINKKLGIPIFTVVLLIVLLLIFGAVTYACKKYGRRQTKSDDEMTDIDDGGL